jgi:hypothetical protein
VDDRVGVVDRFPDEAAVADVADDQLDLVGEVLRPLHTAYVHLVFERVEHPDAVDRLGAGVGVGVPEDATSERHRELHTPQTNRL